MQSVHSECNYFGLVRYRHPKYLLRRNLDPQKAMFNTNVSLELFGCLGIWVQFPNLGPKIVASREAWQWQWAVELLRQMPAAKVLPNEVSFSGAISACEKAEYFWQNFFDSQNLRVLCVCLTNQGICLCNLKSRNALYFVYRISNLFGGEPNVFETF